MQDKIEVRWFRGTDIPLRLGNPFRTAETNSTKTPLTWEPFSRIDSTLLEQRFQKFKLNPKSESPVCMPYSLDGLYEVDVIKREVYPVYWDGPVFEVRRGIWFEPKGSGYAPCDDNLTVQLEDGLAKYRHIQKASKDTTSKTTSEEPANQKVAPEWRWPLLGPYLSQMVRFESSTKIAWIQSDYLASKIQRALTQSSGVKIVRGWDEVQNILKKKPAIKKEDAKTPQIPKDSVEAGETSLKMTPDIPPMPPQTEEKTKKTPTKMRKIDRLIFVIHGIGQKLSATMGTGLSFINDCDILRNNLNECSSQLAESLKANKQENILPGECAVQVIPIHWRQKLNVTIPGSEPQIDPDTNDYEPGLTLGDIMPEGIPGIRMLISDVILDVLLYMTPKYRREMIHHVSSELNRVLKVFIERNPDFTGSVSIYGHSLGSVIAYDIATHQSSVSEETTKPQSAGIDLSDVLGGHNILNSRLGGLIIEENVSFDAPKLDFKIVNLYSVGSPIGMFLFLAGLTLRPPLKEGDEDYSHLRASRPLVQSLYNIYHAYDPVAHRIEPLVSSKLTSLRPFNIPYTKGGITKTVKGIEQAGTEVLQRGRDLISSMYSSAGSMIGSLSSLVPTSTQGSDVELDDVSKRNSPSQGRISVNSPESPQRDIHTELGGHSSDKSPSKKAADIFNKTKPILHPDPTKAQQDVLNGLVSLNPYGRLDFVLQESILENPYLSSLAVHMNYWNDSDVNSLIIRSLYGLTSL